MPGSPNPGSTDTDAIPAIRTFQFDSTSIGELSSAVNLFRGDVNIPQNLFTLPGRASGGAMDVNFTILYQSNVYRDAVKWNRDAPTGVLGLGWGLPLTYIQAADNGSPDPDTRTYVLFDNGGPNELVRQPQQHFLFTMPSSVANSLQSGQAVPAAVRAYFLENGLPLDASATASGSAGAWSIADNVLQQLFSIQAASASSQECVVCYGGQSFQLQSYRFWQIVYFPAYERWLIVTDDGTRKSFGGVAPNTPQGHRTAAGNSIAWEVWWGANGTPVWTGPSSLTSGQMQVASAWYLESTSNLFGDRITYTYNGWTRGANGLIPDVEQQVGAGGLPYTKAVYLTSVKDVFGRTATLSYEDKLWNESGPREYSDPHRETPSNDPNAYQDLYETKYLSNIALTAANGAALYTVQFGYQPSPSATGPEQAVANVTSFTGTLYYDTFKRFLTSVTVVNAAGDSLPGYLYKYYLGGQATGAQPGALNAVTAPQGGSVTYNYTQQELQVCARSQAIPRPGQTPNGVPRVFYGDDYVVSLWYDAAKSILTLQVYTWAGRWICWQLDSASPVLYNKAFNPPTIGAITNTEFFVIYFDTNDSSLAWVFSKDAARPGQFVPAAIPGANTGVNTPTLTFSRSSGTVTYTGGDTFFAAAQMNTSSSKWVYKVLTWRWSTQSWQVETVTPPNFTWLAAGGEYLLAVDWKGNVNLTYLDGTLTWQTAAAATISGFAVPGSNYENVAVTASAGMVVMNLLKANSASLRQYQIYVIQWDANHKLQPVASPPPIIEPQAPNGPPLGWAPVIVANNLIAINGNLLRFNGETWLSNTNLAVKNPQLGSTQRYSYGPDYALQVTTNSQGYGISAAVLGFDPDADSSAWATAPATPSLPPAQKPYDNWPAGGNADYAVLGPYLYFRGTATDWTTVPSHTTPTNIASLAGQGYDSQSLINEGSAFLSYCILSQPQSPAVQSIVLMNGQAGAPVPFSSQRMYTPSIEGGPAGPGASPQGPSVFVSYNSGASGFNSASVIYLNHYAGDAVSGPIVHYPVTSVAVDDQYQDIATTSYFPDPSQAACDPTGSVVKYYQNTVYPGSADPTSPSYGKSVSTYQNGLKVEAANYYDMLDGLLALTELYDSGGNLLESHHSAWQVTQQVASDPVEKTAPAIQLRGGWVMRTQKVSVVDGVTQTKAISYAATGFPGPYSGRPVTTTTSSYDGNGNPQTFTQASTYGPEVSAAMRALNMRSAAVQSTALEQTGTASAIAVKSSASFYSPWPSAAGEGVQVPAKESSFRLVNASGAVFPFASYTPGGTPAGWLLERRVTARTASGQEAESKDGCGISSCVIFSADLTFEVAHVSNAAVGEAAYLGFEPYENISAWTLTNTRFDTTDARTGTTSLLLPGGAAAQLSVKVVPGNTTYVVGFWYKTAAGYTPAAGAGSTIVTGGASNTSAFEPTNGQWVLKTIGVPIGGGGSPSIEVTLANPTATDVLLDSVYIVPLAGGMIARTFDEESQVMTSSADAGGRTRWSLYDSFLRPTLQVGPNAQPKELAQRFLSRQGSSGGVFQATSPNAELTLHPADGGSVETFLDGGAWQQSWQPGNPQAWRASGGSLSHVGTGADTLVYKGEMKDRWAVYFEVAVGSQQPTLTLEAGSISVSYSGGGYTGWSGAQPLVTPPQMARHWLLVAGDGVMMLFGDGQLIFSVPGNPTIGPPSITTSADLTFSNLAFLASPRVSLSYKDGSGRQRQAHRLYGADSRVSEVIFDALGRKIATTRVAPGSFGSGANQPVLQYRPGFVDVAGFLASLSSSWKMTGDVADYYQGQVVNGIQRSNDQGYPYRGTRWEASPRKRKIEIGLPGKPYSIHDVGSTTPAQRMTTQFVYGSNSGANPQLPSAQYSQTTVTTPVKSVAYRINDKVGQSVASVHEGSTGGAVAQSAGVRSYAQTAAGPQITLNLQLPNAIISGPQSGDASYVRTTSTDAANRTVASTDPDTGQTQFLYDPCGRVRFVQPAMGTHEEWFFYTCYDAVGRVMEQGTIAQAWNPAVLGPLAAQPDWPTADVPHTVAMTLSYDGDGNDPTLIGQKTGCVTTTPAPEEGTPCVAEEVFTYDASGKVTGAVLTVSGPASSTGATGYSYNNLGELTALTLPSGSPLAQVIYSMNDQGWITTIGSSAGSPSDIAAYTYSADGVVETESLGKGAWARAVEYTSPGWVQQVVTTSADNQQRLTMSYTYNADSTIATRDLIYAFPSTNGELSDSYTYDGQGRLVSAQGSSNDKINTYDPNGNILEVTRGDTTQKFTQVTGSDQLQQATIDGSSSAISYDVRGRVVSGLGRTLSYDNATNLTIGGSVGSQKVQLGYGGRRQRVLKQASGQKAATTVYFTGPSGSTVARLDGTTWTALVYGPTGLVATYSDQAYYPLKDNEHNAWAVVNSTGLVARYVYLPFGAIVTADGPNPEILPYTFMGQEWDAELSLYNFRDRFYDPLLRRYLTPDPQRQFPSPYIFCANNPLSVTDPTGDVALWLRIEIGIGMGALVIAGIVASVLTAGAAAPAVAAGEAALAGAEAGGAAAAAGAEAAAAGAGTAAAGGAAAGGAAAAEGGAVAAESGAAAAAEVGAGAASGAAAASTAAASTLGSNLSYLGLQAVIGMVEGVGTSGLQYDIQNGRTFTFKDFFENVGWGALSGAVGGVLGGIPGMPALQGAMNSLRPLAQFGINVAAQGVAGAVASDVTQILSNVTATGPDRPAWYSGLLESTLIGGGSSALIGGIASGISARAELGTDLKSIGTQTLDRASSALDSLQAAAKTNDAKMCFGTAAFFVTAGFFVWGAVKIES